MFRNAPKISNLCSELPQMCFTLFRIAPILFKNAPITQKLLLAIKVEYKQPYKFMLCNKLSYTVITSNKQFYLRYNPIIVKNVLKMISCILQKIELQFFNNC